MEIFKIKLKQNVCPKINLKDLVDLTEGYSGAEIENICQEAGIKALEENLNATQITMEHFRMALAKVPPRITADSIKIYNEFEKGQ